MKKLNVVIPMAGAGSRFKRVGYSDPKPLINVLDKPMIEWVIDNMQVPNRQIEFIFICREEHVQQYNLTKKFEEIIDKKRNTTFRVITVKKLTEGACCTVLKARAYINNDDELLIANSDQYMLWNSGHFIRMCSINDCDGAVPSFYSTHPKWSYSKVDEGGWVTQIREKEVISPHATVGVYYFKRGRDFVFGADDMIHKNIRVQGEFYVAPVYNQIITPLGLKVMNYPIPVQSMWGLGTPEDLIQFINMMEAKKKREADDVENMKKIKRTIDLNKMAGK